MGCQLSCVTVNMLKTIKKLAKFHGTLQNQNSSLIQSSIRRSSQFNKPVQQNVLPRPAGIASFMRLPVSSLNETDKLDACIVGVPVDTATSNRPGTRFGPREIRTESVMVRPRSHWTGD